MNTNNKDELQLSDSGLAQDFSNVLQTFKLQIQSASAETLKYKCKTNNISLNSKLKQAEIVQCLLTQFTNIFDIIKEFNMNDLKNICKYNSIRNYSTLKKNELIIAIMKLNASCAKQEFVYKIPELDTIKEPDTKVVKDDVVKSIEPVKTVEPIKLLESIKLLEDEQTLEKAFDDASKVLEKSNKLSEKMKKSADKKMQKNEKESVKELVKELAKSTEIESVKATEIESVKAKPSKVKSKPTLVKDTPIEPIPVLEEPKESIIVVTAVAQEVAQVVATAVVVTKKQAIPKSIKKIVWDTYVGHDIIKHRCLCCKRVTIDNTNFHCGHVISEKDGGTLETGNLRPICAACNHSMGTENMIDFVKKYGLFIG